MPTYGGMQDNIVSLLSRSDLNSLVPTAILNAIRHYETRPFQFNEARSNFVTVSGTEFYTLDAFSAVVQAKVNANGSRYTLKPETVQALEDADVSSNVSQPASWALFGGLMRLFPTPDASYTVSYSYMKKPATLSATADSNVWTTDANNLIEARALWWLHQFKTRKLDLAGGYKAAELEALQQLGMDTANKVTGRIRSTQF